MLGNGPVSRDSGGELPCCPGTTQLEEDQKQIVTAEQQLATELEGTAMNVSASVPLPDSLLTAYACFL